MVSLEIAFAIAIQCDKVEHLRLVCKAFNQILTDKHIWVIKLSEYGIFHQYEYPMSVYYFHKIVMEIHESPDTHMSAILPQKICLRIRNEKFTSDNITYFDYAITHDYLDYNDVAKVIVKQDNMIYRTLIDNTRSLGIPCCEDTFDLLMLTEDRLPLETYIAIYNRRWWNRNPCINCIHRRMQLARRLIDAIDYEPIVVDLITNNRFGDKHKLLILSCKSGQAKYVKKLIASLEENTYTGAGTCNMTKRIKLNVSKFVANNNMEILRFIRANGYAIKNPEITNTTAESTANYVTLWYKHKIQR